MVRTAHAMIRITALVGLLLSIGAIGLGRLSPDDRGRTRASSGLVGVSSFSQGATERGLRLLDLNEGISRSIPLDPFERIDLATASPWIDAWDQVQVVGRWTVHESDGALSDCGLSRVAAPSGRVLDRISLDHYPVAPPCWGSGTSARVLFVSGDGNLYRYDFDSACPSDESGLDQVRWAVDASGTSPGIVLMDVSRPDGILSADLLLVTVMKRGPSPRGGNSSDRSEIWWLRVGAEDEAIIACGPLTTPDPEGLDIGRHRPTLGLRSDGTPWLAYLSWRGISEEMALPISPVRIDERTGIPSVGSSPGIVLADSCLNASPVFADGGSSLAYQTLGDHEPKAVRIPLDESPEPEVLASSDRSDR